MQFKSNENWEKNNEEVIYNLKWTLTDFLLL